MMAFRRACLRGQKVTASNHEKEAEVTTGLLGVWMHSFGDRLKLLNMTQEKLLSAWERTGERLRRAWACHAFT